MLWIQSLLFSAVIAVPSAAFAAAPDSIPEADETAAIRAVRIAEPIRIDGRMDDAAWERALPVTDFTQIDPDEGAPATERTEARILFDDAALYVGVRLWDRGEISSRLGRRDMPIAGDSDWLGVMLDSDHDRQTAFGFDVNPHGVKRDLIKTVNRDDNSWDAVWEVATTIDEEGWTAEMRIPFSQLRFNSEDQQVWGIQIERLIARNGEYAVSTFIPKNSQGGVPEYGRLVGIEGIETGRRLEVMPYGLMRTDAAAGAGPAYGATAGVDVQYRLTSELTLSATVNPDFGQVELDPAEVNLSAFETFFPERRPFFVKDAGIFGFGSDAVGTGSLGRNLFYSRRIGRAPQLGQTGVDSPDAASILGAAKLTGRTDDGWSLGLMNTATGAAWGSRIAEGEQQDVLVEPFTNYFAGRASRDLREGRSAVGGIVTSVHRDLASPAAAEVLGSAAYTGGVDFRHEWEDRNWSLSGFAAGSHLRGSPDAMARLQNSPARYFGRPDADHLELDATATSLSGYAGQLQLRRQGGRRWRGDVGVFAFSPGYEVNDLGYMPLVDVRGANAQLNYLQRTPGSLVRSYGITASGIYTESFAGERSQSALVLGGNWSFQNFWSANVTAIRFFEHVDDRLTRGGPATMRPAQTQMMARVGSDPRQGVSARASMQYQQTDAGGSNRSVDLALTARPSPRWNLSVGPMLRQSRVDAQYLATVPDPAAEATYGHRYVFAELDQTTVALETRLNVTFTPDLTLELFAQPFLSSLTFGDPEELVAPRTYEFAPYAGSQEIPDPSFNLRSLRGNAVLRWEWSPGSTVYVAWQQQRGDRVRGIGGFDLGRDVSALFRTAPDNVLMLKVSHWLNF